MHNTSTEYSKTISWNYNWILIFIRYVGRFLLKPFASSSSSLMTSSFLIQMLRWIRGSSWIESFIFLIAWGIFVRSATAPIFSFSYYESSFFLCALFLESTESNHFTLAQIPPMNESHDPGRPLKVAITTSSSTATIFSLIWETLVKYDCMVSSFWIFTFFK